MGKSPYRRIHWENEKTIITHFHRKYQRANLYLIAGKLTTFFEYACAKYNGEPVCFSDEGDEVNPPIVLGSPTVRNAATNWQEIIRGLLMLGADPCGWMRMNHNRIDRFVVSSETVDPVKQKKVAIYAIIAGEAQFTISHYQLRENAPMCPIPAVENNLMKLFNAAISFGQQLNSCVESDQALLWRWVGYYVLPVADGFRLDRAALFATALQLLYKSLNGLIDKAELQALHENIKLLHESYMKKIDKKNPVYNTAYNVGRDGYALLYKITKEMIEVCLQQAIETEKSEEHHPLLSQREDNQLSRLAQAHQETEEERKARLLSDERAILADKKAEEADKKAEEERKARISSDKKAEEADKKAEEERKARISSDKKAEEMISLLLKIAIETKQDSFAHLENAIITAAVNGDTNDHFYAQLITLTDVLVGELCEKIKSANPLDVKNILLRILETDSTYPEIALLIQQAKTEKQDKQEEQDKPMQQHMPKSATTAAGLFSAPSEAIVHNADEKDTVNKNNDRRV